MEKKVMKIYIRPFTEVIMVENTQSHLETGSAGHDPIDDGGIIGGAESKQFFDWSFHEREGISSDKMDNGFDD